MRCTQKSIFFVEFGENINKNSGKPQLVGAIVTGCTLRKIPVDEGGVTKILKAQGTIVYSGRRFAFVQTDADFIYILYYNRNHLH